MNACMVFLQVYVWANAGADLGILRGGGVGVLGRNSSRGGGGGGVRVQVRGNFHILTSKKRQTSGGGGLNALPHPHPLDPPLAKGCIV